MRTYLAHNIRYLGIRISTIIPILFVLFATYLFFNSSVTIFNFNIRNSVYLYIENLEWWLQIIIYITVLSFTVSILLIILSFFFLKKREIFESSKNIYEVLFTKNLINHIYSESLNKAKKVNNASFFRVMINNKLAKEVFFSSIIRFQLLISNNLSAKLNTLIEDSGLARSYKHFLYSYSKSDRIIAIKIISYINSNAHIESITLYLNSTYNAQVESKFKKYKKVIYKYMNSNNITLSNEATTALIKLSKAKDLAHILSKRKHISRLGINTIIAAVEEVNKNDIDFNEILRSENTRVVAVGILLVMHYDKIKYKSIIREILERKEVLLHEIAWEAFTYFSDSDEDFDFMTSKFKEETSHNKMSIVNSLHKFINNKKLTTFLDDVINNEDVELKVSALKILFEVNISVLLTYKNSTDKKVVDAYKEVTDITIF